jgi:triacylglycerol lipase
VVYTFASPRVGNDKFQAAFRLQHRRWVNQNDLVTQLPPELFGYRPVGTFDHILDNRNVKLNDKERASPVGDVLKFIEALTDRNLVKHVQYALSMHAPPLYSRALYNNLPNALKSKMPDPPTR